MVFIVAPSADFVIFVQSILGGYAQENIIHFFPEANRWLFLLSLMLLICAEAASVADL